jgi:ribosome-associated toxin RatA of RatAB toxin-antitoxin module
MPVIKKEALVTHSTGQMFDLVNAIEHYPEFLPWCSESQVLSRDEDEIRASLVVAGAGLSKSFTTHNRLQKDKMIEIRLVDGPFKHLEGFWRFEKPEDDQHACHVMLDLEFEFSGYFIDYAFGAVFQQVAGTLVDAFVQRADTVYAG